ncbi:IncP-type conjugal transfer protein TraG [Pseudoxanthomonas sacheonensis]|uniref:Type IV secretion system protein VirD4 n=1 Tax=Pseudoxanthomonas sacheonensis TaxID=443615 RepID=A0ABU1RR86_9GAMM|nr:IncP-type conjugal transfer protein TraG [Pseudoxanthomonas sacheonensis]MDR6841301.1 type IV secretion system protein VirD4 [Pseudoxanthomonas sacheonensis]
MASTKMSLLQISLACLLALVGLWSATQWTAGTLGHDQRLGAPWFHLRGMPVYRPWQLFPWWLTFEAQAPRVFNLGGLIAAGGGLLAAAVAGVAPMRRGRHAPATTFGSARWGTGTDAVEARVIARSGVFLGQLDRDYLRHDGAEHVMTFAPTRSGKGVGLVVPTLLSWPHSVVVHDIKGENWQITAGWRARFSHCLRFDPTDAHSAAYNPLLEVRRGTQEVRDVQNIADILVDPEGALERRSHWEKTGHALLVGAILHVLYAEPDKTLHGVANFLSDPVQPFEAALWSMMSVKHLGDATHPVVASAARELLNKSENERSGVLSTAMSFLGLYRDPTVAQVTSRCDWRIADLVQADCPVSLYLVVPPSDISRTKPLIRLLLNQIGRRLTETIPDPPPAPEPWIRRWLDRRAVSASDAAEGKPPQRHPLLWMLDEFPALGRLDFFESALAFMAGYDMRAFLIAQSLNQIEKAYGPNSSILDNCHVRVAFAANDERTATRISEALGTATEVRQHRSFGGDRFSFWLDHVSVSMQSSPRPLLTPGEVMQLPPDEEIVMVAGHPPIRAKKLRYFEDRNFLPRLLPPPTLSESGYVDRPTPRPDHWTGSVIARPDALTAYVAGAVRSDLLLDDTAVALPALRSQRRVSPDPLEGITL